MTDAGKNIESSLGHKNPAFAAGLLHFMQRRIYMPMIASFSDPFGTPDKLHGSVRAVGETGIGLIRLRYVDERGEAVGGKLLQKIRQL